jgi:hypothetical protein
MQMDAPPPAVSPVRPSPSPELLKKREANRVAGYTAHTKCEEAYYEQLKDVTPFSKVVCAIIGSFHNPSQGLVRILLQNKFLAADVIDVDNHAGFIYIRAEEGLETLFQRLDNATMSAGSALRFDFVIYRMNGVPQEMGTLQDAATALAVSSGEAEGHTIISLLEYLKGWTLKPSWCVSCTRHCAWPFSGCGNPNALPATEVWDAVVGAFSLRARIAHTDSTSYRDFMATSVAKAKKAKEAKKKRDAKKKKKDAKATAPAGEVSTLPPFIINSGPFTYYHL